MIIGGRPTIPLLPGVLAPVRHDSPGLQTTLDLCPAAHLGGTGTQGLFLLEMEGPIGNCPTPAPLPAAGRGVGAGALVKITQVSPHTERGPTLVLLQAAGRGVGALLRTTQGSDHAEKGLYL